MRSLILALLLVAGPALRAGDEVVVLSPFMVQSVEGQASPPITIRKTGDFLLLQVTLINDTRDPDHRRAEVYATIQSILEASAAIPHMEIATAEMTLRPRNFQVPLHDLHEKSDACSAELHVKLPLSPTDDVGGLTAQLRAFVQSTRVTGRTEIFPGEIGISVRNPERFRYEVISKVAEDVKKMRELFGDRFEITVHGLDQRLKWQRSSVSELEFFIPYTYDAFPIKSSGTIPAGKD